MSAHTEIDVFSQRQTNSTVLRAFQPPFPHFKQCSFPNVWFQCSAPLLCKIESQTTPDITSFKPLLHFHVCFTCPSSSMWEAIDFSTLYGPLPRLPYFGMPVPGICSNSSLPVGIGMSPSSPSAPLSSLLPVSVYLMYASTCMKQPKWTPHHQHKACSLHILLASHN